jgi:hypothetical protein
MISVVSIVGQKSDGFDLFDKVVRRGDVAALAWHQPPFIVLIRT